jgi:hypothetical protein
MMGLDLGDLFGVGRPVSYFRLGLDRGLFLYGIMALLRCVALLAYMRGLR